MDPDNFFGKQGEVLDQIEGDGELRTNVELAEREEENAAEESLAEVLDSIANGRDIPDEDVEFIAEQPQTSAKRKRGRPKKNLLDRLKDPEEEANDPEAALPRKRGRPKKFPPQLEEVVEETIEVTQRDASGYSCQANPDLFCFVCASFTPTKTARRMTPFLQLLYRAYFGFPPENLEQWWTPNVFCSNCYSILNTWYYGKTEGPKRPSTFPFSKPAIWKDPGDDHLVNCWFCVTKVVGFSVKTRKFVKYPWGIASVEAPVPRGEDEEPPETPYVPPSAEEESRELNGSENEVKQKNPDLTEGNVNQFVSTAPQQFTKETLDEFFKNIGPISQIQREFITSTFDKMNLLNITRKSIRNRAQGKRKNYRNMDTGPRVDPVDSEDEEVLRPNELLRQNWAESKDKDFKVHHRMEGRRAKKIIEDGILLISVDLICLVEGCETRVPDKWALDEHLEADHGVYKYRCLAIGCAQSFQKRRPLFEHIVTDHPTNDRSIWKCGRCLAIKSDYNHLYNHIVYAHQRGSFRCGSDGCTFAPTDTTRSDMKAHQRTAHPTAVECTYPECGRTFKSKASIARHLRTHTNDRPYKCEELACGKGFFSRTDLDRHTLIHLGLKPFSCPACGQAFRLKGSMDKHLVRLHPDWGVARVV